MVRPLKEFLRADLDTYKPVFELFCYPCEFKIISFKDFYCS